jgi:hypothetical protein
MKERGREEESVRYISGGAMGEANHKFACGCKGVGEKRGGRKEGERKSSSF